MDNEQCFREAYTQRLADAVQAHPEDYTWPPTVTIGVVVERMIESIKRKGFAMSPAIKAAAKDCGVSPQTMTNISDYVNGKLEVIN